MYTGIGNSGHVAKPTLKNGLIWYWDLAASAATITDSHSRLALTRSGTVNTLTAGAPDYGSCVEFPSPATVISSFRNTSVARQASYLDSFTTNIWVMDYDVGIAPVLGNWYFNHRGGAANTDYWQSVTAVGTPNVLQTTIFNSTSVLYNVSFTQQPLNTWYMVTMVKHSNQIDMYVNTEQVSQSLIIEGTMSANSAALAIGRAAWDTTNLNLQHRGRLFGAGVWGRALKNPEIVALYNSGYGRRYENL